MANVLEKLKKKSSTALSLPGIKKIRGYTIKKMPLGDFLKATQTLQDFPRELMAAIFPGESPDDIFAALKAVDKETAMQLIVRAFLAIPERMVGLFAELSGLNRDTLLNDKKLGPDGFMELVTAWVEVNGIENFMAALRGVYGKVRGMMKPGSKD